MEIIASERLEIKFKGLKYFLIKIMLNPEEIALHLREKVVKDGKFLISKIAGSKQAPGETKILEEFFRYKDYLDKEENADWFSSSLEEVWDAKKWKGLRENFRELPLPSIKKLEFENPCYSAAFRIEGKNKGDPRKYAKVFTFQLNACDYDCIYCYVPSILKNGNVKWGRFFNAKEIVDNFFEIRRKNIDMQVLRASGGEVFCIAPELTYDIYCILNDEHKEESIYLWIDTNLSTTKILEKFESELKEMFKSKNVGIVGCFKGTNKKEFEIITGCEGKFYEKQYECANYLLNLKADFYVYLPALIYGDNIKENLYQFIEKLERINKNLPLRVEMLIIIDYPQAIENRERCKKLGRNFSENDQKDVFEIWYSLLKEKYGEKFYQFCCEVQL